MKGPHLKHLIPFLGILALGFQVRPQAWARATGVIQGKVLVTAPARHEKTYSDYSTDLTDLYGSTAYSSSPPPKAPAPLPEEIAVYLEEVPGQWNPPLEHARLDQKYTQFTHRVLPVLAGTVVDFTNNDPVYHNVFSNSEINHFDLGRRHKGETASARLRRLEIPVRLFCEIHSTMKSNILVLQNPFFTVIQPGGSFRLEGVPAGTYRLVAWHDYWQPVDREVTVRAGETTQVDLTLTKAQK